MINRDEYLNKLIRFKDKELIKVVTGIRRCGKSTLFDLYIEYLLQNGISQDQIIRLNLEDPIYHELDNYLKLYNYIKDKTNASKMNYIFIDEVQNIPEFQKAVDGLYIQKNTEKFAKYIRPITLKDRIQYSLTKTRQKMFYIHNEYSDYQKRKVICLLGLKIKFKKKQR